MAVPRVAVVGLGIMGGAIARNLVASGCTVYGFDPSPATRDAASECGVHAAADFAEVPLDVDLVLISLPSAAALFSVLDDLAEKLREGSVVAELSTLALEDKQAAREFLASHRICLLDCPISGTGAQAAARDLSVYVSGEVQAWERTAEIFKLFANRPRYVGTFGSGTQLKYIANLLVAIHNVASAEAMAMAEAAGIDLQTAVDVLREGAGNSRIFELRAPMMARRAYTPPTMKLGVWRKDMQLIGAFARKHGLRTPLFDATLRVYESAEKTHTAEDTAAVFEVIRTSHKTKDVQ